MSEPDDSGPVAAADHHSEYLARATAALTPEGRKRVDELLEQLAAVVGGHERVARFASVRKGEADAGRADVTSDREPALSSEELGVMSAGFKAIRDQEPLDDVADWANAVVALLEDEASATG
jgi:hypothetical protein